MVVEQWIGASPYCPLKLRWYDTHYGPSEELYNNLVSQVGVLLMVA